MTSTWKFQKTFENNLCLSNGCGTILHFNKRVNVDVVLLFEKMEQANVPFFYTNGLSDIYFTYLPNRGDYNYETQTIRLSCDCDINVMASTLSHELGHHIDMIEGISKDKRIVEENSRRNLIAEEGGESAGNCDEYVAFGFEKYYFGKRGSKTSLYKKNRRLYNKIRFFHKKYVLIGER